jgi:hypothetical protein
MASLVNLLAFLPEGKHPTLVDRVLGLQPVSVAPSDRGRAVGYSYMTRELLWHGFIVSTILNRDTIIIINIGHYLLLLRDFVPYVIIFMNMCIVITIAMVSHLTRNSQWHAAVAASRLLGN